MDSSTLRRRNSICLDPRRKCLLLRAHRSNPHIGWSRHAPDTSFLSQQQQEVVSSSSNLSAFRGSLKSSPYVGFLRHAPATVQVSSLSTPSSRCRDEFYERLARKWLEEELHFYLKSLPLSSKNEVRCLEQLLDTRLRGGNDKYGRAMTTGHRSLKVLYHLKTWFLLPFQEDDYDHDSWNNIKQIEQDQMSLEDEASDADSVSVEEQGEEHEEDSSGDDEYSNYSASDEPSVGEPDDYGRPPLNALDTGISSQAEAYYAHQVTKDLTVNPDDHTTVLPSPSSSRLDYVITQMDIVRMHRNASRHLDVESIYKLPTITYHVPPPHPSSSKDQRQADKMSSKMGEKSEEGWSWMFIPSDKNKIEEESSIILEEGGDSVGLGEKEDVCVICLESYQEGDRLRVLPCNHSFHVGCVDRWLSGSCSFDDCHTAGCPTCKKRADTGLDAGHLDGSVPSWAFAQLGRSLARECSSEW